jgi:hypothetical protein
MPNLWVEAGGGSSWHERSTALLRVDPRRISIVGQGQCSSDRGLYQSPIPQREQHIVNLDEARRYCGPIGIVIPSLRSLERHAGVQSRTPILGPDRSPWHWTPQRIVTHCKHSKYNLHPACKKHNGTLYYPYIESSCVGKLGCSLARLLDNKVWYNREVSIK